MDTPAVTREPSLPRIFLILFLVLIFPIGPVAAEWGRRSNICGSWNNDCGRGGGGPVYVPPPPTPGRLAKPWFDKAMKAQKAGRLREAERAYLQAIRINPGDSAAHNNLGNVYWDLGLYQKAIDSYHRAIRLAPGKKMARDNLAKLLRWLQWQKERRAFRRAWDLAERKRYAEAERAYRRLLRMNPRQQAAWNNLGNVLWNLDRRREAERAYLRALSIKPNDTNANNNLKNLRAQMARLRREARREAERRAYRRAGSAYDKGNYAAAVRDLRAYLRTNPPKRLAVRAMRRIAESLKRLGRIQEAERAYLDAIARDPGDRYTRSEFEHFKRWVVNRDIGRAEKLMKGGRPGEAVQLYKKVLEKHPGNASAWNNMGNALWKMRRLDEAERAYLKALEGNPGDKIVRDNLTMLRRNRNFHRAWSLFKQGRYAEAEKTYRRIIRTRPSSIAWNNLGNALWNQGRKKEAQAAYRRALSLDPKNKHARKNLADARRYNESYFRYLDPVFEPLDSAMDAVRNAAPVRAVGGYAGRLAESAYGLGKQAAGAALDRSAAVWRAVRRRLARVEEGTAAPGSQLIAQPLVDFTKKVPGSLREARKNAREKVTDWLKDKSAEQIAQKIPGVRIVKSLGEKFQKRKKEFNAAAEWSLKGLFSTIEEGAREAGSARLDDDIVDRSAGLYERIGNKWRNLALKTSKDEVGSRIKGGGLFGGSGGGGREEKSRVVAILGWRKDRRGYAKWLGNDE